MTIFSLTAFYKRTVWEFPQERFVTYEPKDEPWCRYFGIGKEVDTTSELHIPRAFVRRIRPNGEIEVMAIPSDSEPLLTMTAEG